MASPLATAYLQAAGAGMPPTPFRSQIQPTDVEKAYADYNNAQQQAYAAEVAKQNSMFGGLAGLGGAAITTLPKLLSGSGGLSSLFGGGAGSSVDLAGIPDALASGIAPEDLLASLALV